MAIRTEAADIVEVVRKGPPRFITVEGIDGSGKTSVTAALVAEFEARGTPVVTTREPTDTWIGEAVKRASREDVSPFTDVFLFLADRADHTRRIQDWLAEGKFVISDRYADSTYAYQAVSLQAGGMGGDPLFWLKNISAPVVMDPDLTLLLMVSPSVAMERLKDREERAKFESLGFLEMVSENYIDLASGEDRFLILDAEKPLKAVVEDAKEAVFTR